MTPCLTLPSEHYPGHFAQVELDGPSSESNRLPVHLHLLSVILPGGGESGATLVLTPGEAQDLAAGLTAVSAAALAQVPAGQTLRQRGQESAAYLDRLDALSLAACVHAQARGLNPAALAIRLGRYERIAEVRRRVRHDVLRAVRSRPILGSVA